MKWVGDSQYARVIEDGTFDRYYFTFDEPILKSVSLASSSTLPANLTVSSSTELLVEVAPGMEVGDGFDVVIDVVPLEELAVTGAGSAELLIIGLTVLVAGAMLVTAARNGRREPARI